MTFTRRSLALALAAAPFATPAFAQVGLSAADQALVNRAVVYLEGLSEAKGRFGRRLIYGGHVISLARALSFNGLGNVFHVAAINGGRHVAPLFGDASQWRGSDVVHTQCTLRCAPTPKIGHG